MATLQGHFGVAYTIVKQMSETMVAVEVGRYGRQFLFRAAQPNKKHQVCANCGAERVPYTARMWRPNTNRTNRPDRFCDKCVRRAMAEAQQEE